MPPVFTAEMFRAAFLRLLPTGPIWQRKDGSIIHALATAWGQTFSRNAARASYLLTDANPATTTELLPDWEASLGLPDPCSGENPTLSLRRAQVNARLTDTGGCSAEYYINFAKSLGYEITITQFAPARFGQAKFGTPYYGREWAYVWQVNCPSIPVIAAQFGGARFGDPYRTWGGQVLICEISSRIPAHTKVLFNWGEKGNPSFLGKFILDANTLS